MSYTKEFQNKTYQLPTQLSKSIEKALNEICQGKVQGAYISECIQKLSDFYIHNPQSPTPWSEKWAQIAYLSYYLPLNFLRIADVIQSGKQKNFFSQFTHLIDFGAGLGTASLAFDFANLDLSKSLIETGIQAQQITEKYFSIQKSNWDAKVSLDKIKNPQTTLVVFSYSLTELEQIPSWALACEGLMILEPSTQQDARRLMQWRENLVQKGWYIHAPCTHQKKCPLLVHSKKDWCHDRIYFPESPEWMQKFDSQLPMKNKSLTTSYLLLKKSPPVAVAPQGRVIGDLLKENGKDRQLFCQGEEREFLTWMHKNKNTEEIPRGILYELPNSIQKVANEIRILPSPKT